METTTIQTWAIFALVAGFLIYRKWKWSGVKKTVQEKLQAGAVVVDVRSPGEFRAGHNPQSVNIPLAELGKKLVQLDKAKPLIVCCASGARSGAAEQLLKRQGFQSITNAGPWQNTLVSGV